MERLAGLGIHYYAQTRGPSTPTRSIKDSTLPRDKFSGPSQSGSKVSRRAARSSPRGSARYFQQHRLRVFLSYSTKDKKLAGRLKSQLEHYGFEVFLAHDDISPSRAWEEEILKQLRRCDLFLAVLTRNFHRSYWVDQETGIAFSLKKQIIPLKIDLNPYGFAAGFQAFTLKRKRLSQSCRNLFLAVIREPKLKTRTADSTVWRLSGSESYDDSKKFSSLLLEFDSLSKRQLDEIFRAASRNDQVYGSIPAMKSLSRLVRKYHDYLDPRILKAFRNSGRIHQLSEKSRNGSLERSLRRTEKLAQEIRFDYLDSPTKHGWQIAEGNEGRMIFKHLSDDLVASALEIKSPEKYAMDFLVAGEGRKARRLELMARFGSRSAFYAQVSVQSKNASKPKDVWLAFQVGSAPPKPYADGSHEWLVFLLPTRSRGTWPVFLIDLNDTVMHTFGNEGWSFKHLIAFRIRGNFSLASIGLLR